MPNPTRGDVHVNRPLTNISVAYMQDATNFIAGRVFPVVSVQKQSDTYFTYSKDDFFRDEAKERAPGTESAGGGFNVSTAPPYFCRVYSWHEDIADQTRANQDDPLSLDQDATEVVTQKMLLKREKTWVSGFFKAGVWGTNKAGVTGSPSGSQFKRWDEAGSTPIADIENERIRIGEMTGHRPNKLVLNPYVFMALRNHAEVLDRIKYTQRGLVSAELLASLLEVDEVLVPFATENTAKEGAAGAYNFVYGKGALLVHAAKSPGLRKPSGGYTFGWKGFHGASGDGTRIKSFRMEHLESDRIEGEMAYDQKLVSADVGVFFEDAVS